MLNSFLRNLRSDSSGAVIIVFALLLPILVGAIGFGIDLGRAMSERTKAMSAADAAALAAVRQAAALTQDGSASAVTSAISAAKATGQQSWTINAGNISNIAMTLDLTYQGGTWKATVSFSGSVAPTVSNVLGIDTIPINGAVTASAGVDLQTYTNLYLLLDISQSMALPSTSIGEAYLDHVSNCEFACHVPGEDSNFKKLRNKGYPMRIDTLRSAAMQMINSAEATNSTSISIGAWTFNDKVTKISDLTNGFSTLKSKIQAVDVAVYHDGTQFDAAATTMTALIPAGGNGKSAATPMTFLFIVTDGVQDGIYTSYNVPSALLLNSVGGDVGVVQSGVCDALKSKNVKIGILYTTYIPSNSSVYQSWIKPRAGNIPVSLKACASEGLFFEASDDQGIKAAMANMFTTALSMTAPPRLTN